MTSPGPTLLTTLIPKGAGMRLYARAGQAAHKDPETGTVYTADADGAFDFPEELGERLRRFHVEKVPMWEDSIERQQRLMDEELERAKDPATLLGVLQQLARILPAVPAQTSVEAAPSQGAAEEAAPASEMPGPAAKQPRKRAASKPAAPAE